MKAKKFKLFNDFKKKSDDSYTINYLSLFRFASRWDLFLITVGVLFTFLKALALPWTVIVYGEFTSLLVERIYGIGTSSPTIMLAWFGGGKVLTNATLEENRHEIINDSIAYGILAMMSTMLQFISGIFCVDCFNRAAIRQVTRIRCKFFESLMRQDIAWYDITSGKTNFSVRITADIEKIKAGIAEQVSHFLNLIVSFVMCVILAFIYGWELTLIVISYLPIVFTANIFIGKLQAKAATDELNAYARAANVVEEVLSGIRTVFAFGGEKCEVDRYNKLLVPSKYAARRKGFYSSISDGITRFLFFVSCALSFWFGVRWVLEDRDKIDKSYTPADLIIIFFSLVCAADNIAETTPFLEAFAVARGSAKSVFAVIDRKSTIDSMTDDGHLLDTDTMGNIEFNNVSFNYPSRADVPILQNLSLKIEAGQTVALVGDSGNGKSTCLHLLQRFYDPDNGDILIDGYNIRSLNINSLRSRIASVGQEPVLFSTTILENIRYGKPDATDKEIIMASQDSGAHDFIMQLPHGYNTMVGEKGSQLSGGQKQRIAIARALIQNPKILLLDEATSALDYQSEKYIQETLDHASKGRTTVVVSHRLSAIRNADRIVFINKGQVIEQGTHSELLESKGQYYEMVHSQAPEESENQQSKRNRKKVMKKNYMNRKKVKNGSVVEKMHLTHIESSDSISSSSSTDDEKSEDGDETEHVKYWENFKRILILVKPDWMILALAVLSSFIIGSSFPLFSVVFAEVYGTLSIPDPVEAFDEVFTLCVLFVCLGVMIFTAAITQTYLFSRAGANLTQRVRSMTFEAMLKQECGWFDDEKHSVGALSARLSGDAANLQTAIGYPLSIILQAISTFVTGILVSFISSIRLTLVCLTAVPLLLLAVIFEAKHLSKSELSEKEAISIGMKIATEAVNNIRTVASLRQERFMIERFLIEMNKVEILAHKKTIWRGLINSISQAIPFLLYAIALSYGGYLVANDELHYKNIIRISEAMLYGTLFMCQTLVFAPAITTAFVGAHGVFKVLDRIPLIQSPKNLKSEREPDTRNNVDYNQIDFRYPTRPNVQILTDFNLDVAEGKTIALIGQSGCGKSTCIQLLQRLYDPEHGRINIGSDNITADISIADLRSKLSIVSQEPVLFERTIAENIAYGDNKRVVTMSEIIEAAKIANIHDFIVQLPLGYETNLGSKGAQLSGGQKQRIAIARALVRNPKILLLDEATSALDLHSEQVVQQALDAAKSGRTCIIIAHRLSTIQNADMICVLQNGNVIETGTHDELLAVNGVYTRLYNAQK